MKRRFHEFYFYHDHGKRYLIFDGCKIDKRFYMVVNYHNYEKPMYFCHFPGGKEMFNYCEQAEMYLAMIYNTFKENGYVR